MPGGDGVGLSVAVVAVTAVLVLLAIDTAAAGRVARRRLRRRAASSRWMATLGRGVSRGALHRADEALAGAAVIITVPVGLLLGAAAAVLCVASAAAVLWVRQRSRRRRRIMRIERNLPEVIDLLGLVVGAGRPTVAALSDIAPRVCEPYGSELAAVVRRTAAGEPFTDSVRRLRENLGPSVASVVHAVTAAEIDGAPLQPALQRAADEAHRRRRVRAEEAARRVPVLMLFPLVFCVLPAFCLLTVVPLLVGAVTDLGSVT